jgi:hypothetical protein
LIQAIENENDGERLNAVRAVSRILKGLNLHAQDLNIFAGSTEESNRAFLNLASIMRDTLARNAGLSDARYFLMDYHREHITHRQWLWLQTKVYDIIRDAEDAYLKKHGLKR